MARSEFGTPGETTWAPETITTGFRLTSPCTNIVMAFIDLKERIMYVVDEDVNGLPVASTSTDRQGEALKRYINEKRYFNALSLIDTNIKVRKGKTFFADNENIEEKKAEVESNKLRYKNLIEEYRVAVKAASDKEQEVLVPALEKFIEMYESLCNIEFITYNDIAADYTKLFEWMF